MPTRELWEVRKIDVKTETGRTKVVEYQEMMVTQTEKGREAISGPTLYTDMNGYTLNQLADGSFQEPTSERIFKPV